MSQAPIQTGHIGPDGILELFPKAANPRHAPLYLDLSKGDPTSKDGPFAITYGSDFIPSNIIQGRNGAICLETDGAVQHYKPDKYGHKKPDGRSMRAHWFYDCKPSDDGKYSWKDHIIPTYLYSEKAFYNFEMTAVVEVGDPLDPVNGQEIHQSCAFKLRARPDGGNKDDLRSTVECCFPNSQKPDAYFNYNYSHHGYENVDGVKQNTKEGVVESHKPLGLKVVSVIANNRKSSWYGWYINTDPIGSDGKFTNEIWKLKAEYTATGISEYKNIPPVWAGMTDYLRMDGYKKFRLYNFSVREIDKEVVESQIH
jgi:hypothetical protein